jgi:RNA-binding protein FUS|tara:strand:- start:44 stop:448 length:405 start_codon:yes stop_codon:yes gene_type:complete
MGDYDRGGWGNQGGGGGYNQGGYDQGGGGFGGDRGGDRGNSYGGAWGGGGGSRGGRGGGGGGGFSNVRPGDWSCPNGCGNVFASKSNCFRCGVPKPEGAGDSVRPQISPEPRLITYGPALGNAEKTSNRLPSTN